MRVVAKRTSLMEINGRTLQLVEPLFAPCKTSSTQMEKRMTKLLKTANQMLPRCRTKRPFDLDVPDSVGHQT